MVPIHPQPTLAELGPFACLAIDAVLFGNDWGRKPLIVARKLELGTGILAGRTNDGIGAFGGWPECGRGVGDRVVGTFVEGEVWHEGSPQRLRGKSLEDAPYKLWIPLEGGENGGCSG